MSKYQFERYDDKIKYNLLFIDFHKTMSAKKMGN